MTKKFSIRLFCRIIAISVFIPGFISCDGPEGPEVSVYISSLEGDRLTRGNSVNFSKKKSESLPALEVNEGIQYQKIDGFGATFNEAGMICLNSLLPEAQDSLMNMLFNPVSGAGFTLMKSPIGACDFASAGPWYSYNETPGDTAMEHFTIDRDLKPNGLIPFIRKASEYGKFEIESPMDFAPDWMYFGIEKGKKHIKPEYYRALARYYSKYIQTYASHGITIGYLNLFNEGDNHWYSNVTYQAMGEMIKNFIVPQFKDDGLKTKIQLGETSNRPEALKKFPVVLDDPQIRRHIHSLTVHGYDWDKFSTLTGLHEKYPDLPIWMTEVCYVTGTLHPKEGPEKSPVYDFIDGEFWGNMIINDLKNHVSGWIYWNMILDQEGGPWLVSVEHGDPEKNQQHPVVIVDRLTGKVTYTGLYYYLAHFSRFIRPGACMIECSGRQDGLNAVAFVHSDGTFVLNVLNNGAETQTRIVWKDKSFFQKLKAHSITTFCWKSK